jgi:plastocyanin
MSRIAVATVRAVLFASALFAAQAGATDFIFGDGFDTALVCPVGPQPSIVAAVSPSTQQTTLGTQMNYLIQVLSCGFAGAVTLTASGAPASWTVSVDPTSLNLASGSRGVAEMVIAVPTDGDAGLHTITVAAAASGANTASPSTDLNVANEFLIHFAPDGTGAGTHAFYPTSLTVKLGAKLRYIDDDSVTQHRIHAEAVAAGFAHQGYDMSQGQEYDITTLTTISNTLVYCHDHLDNLAVPGNSMKVTVVP